MYNFLNPDTYPRYNHFRRFYDEISSSISMTDDINVTSLVEFCRKNGKSFHITYLYAVAKIINSHTEFKLTAVDSPDFEYPMPAEWKTVHPCHNVFHEISETYTTTYTAYTEDYELFSQNSAEDIERAKRADYTAVPCPPNTFETSAVPWRHFTSVDSHSDSCPLFPTVVWGKLSEKNGVYILPTSISINHAAADGFHLARFLNELENLAMYFQ